MLRLANHTWVLQQDLMWQLNEMKCVTEDAKGLLPFHQRSSCFILWVSVLVQWKQMISSPGHRVWPDWPCVLSLYYFEFIVLTRKGIPHRFRPSVLQHMLTAGIGIVLKAFLDENTKSFPGSFHNSFAVLFMIWLQRISKLVFEIPTFFHFNR